MIFFMISGNSMTYGRPEIVLIFTVLVLASEKVIYSTYHIYYYIHFSYFTRGMCFIFLLFLEYNTFDQSTKESY